MKNLRTFFRVSIACFFLSFCALSAYAQNAGDSIKIHLTNGEIVGIDAFDIDTIKHSPTTMQVQLWNDSIVTYSNVDVVKVEFDPLTEEEIKAIQEKERNALIAIYNALDGDTWQTNTNWCSDKPLNEWENVSTNSYGLVTFLYIMGTVNQNTERGYLPKEIEDLQYLNTLRISNTNLDSLQLEIAHLPRLRHFFSTDNIFLHLSEITPLYQLKNLETLDITINIEHFDISESAQTPIPIPIEIGKLKNLKSLGLNGCNLSGTIPDELWTWVQLESITIKNLRYSFLSGTIPPAIANLKNLRNINLYNMFLTGGIPEELYTLTELINLELDCCGIGGELSPKIKNLTKLNFLNLRECQLEGTLPSDLSELLDKDLSWILLTYNNLTGDIPEVISHHPKWETMWSSVITGNKFNVKASDIPTPHFTSEDVFGDSISSDTIYTNTKYTILYEYDVAMFPYYSIAAYPCNQMHALYNMYHDAGVELVMFAGQFEEDIQEFVTLNQIPWKAVRGAPWGMSVLPNVNIIDSTQTVVLSTLLEETANNGMDTIIQFFAENFPEIQPYRSTDYSNDGKVEIIQQAPQGDGIDIILMGDGYSDRQIVAGDYNKDINFAIEHLFTEEPYKSFKDYFNIYVVTAVSQNEGYEHFGSTAFNCYFGGGTLVGGNDEKVLEYAQKAISAERMDNVNIIVLMNKDEYAGTCYMYYPSTNNDYGTGTSVSYFPVSSDVATFAGLLHHEALGHGFAKLDDEYAYEEYGAAPSEYITERQQLQTNYGWWKNVDFTSDLAAIRWNYFLNDSRYANEGLGAFEGGSTYWTGVWRPTENSIMRYNTGGFNAPSREAIYYRIHKLAFGEDWVCDYEDFVTYDAINRTQAAAARRAAQRRAAEGKILPPSTPPVVIPHSWREAKQDSAILQRKVLQPKVIKPQPQKEQEKQVEKKQEFRHTPPPVVIPHSWNEKK